MSAMRHVVFGRHWQVPRGRLLVALLVVLLARPAAAASSVSLDVRSPENGSTFTHRLNLAYVTGDTWINRPPRRPADVVFLVDSSGSTADPSGADANGNGRVGRNIPIIPFLVFHSTDTGDSILAAEIASARKLLQHFDPTSTEVAVVSFDGQRTVGWGVRGQFIPDAIVEQPLTSEFRLVDAALQRILDRGPDGGTNMAEGVRVAINELTGFQSVSRPRRGADRSIYLFTDGFPTLPFLGANTFSAERMNIELAVFYAETAGRVGIKVNAFAVGKDALSRPLATVDIARVSGGLFTPVPDPAQLLAVVDAVALPVVQRVTVRNTTTGEAARMVQLNPDGTFDSLVPVKAGANTLEIVANASDGSFATQNVSVNYRPATEKLLDVTVDQAKNLDKLLDIRVNEDKSAGGPSKDLFIEIELERQKALQKAEQQRKALGMGTGPITSPPTPPPPGSRPAGSGGTLR
jgi:hypothetical protein